MADENIISRRKFLGAVAAVGAVGLSACATTGQPSSSLWRHQRAVAHMDIDIPNAEVIDGRHRIACPGFIDTHFHLWGSLARGVVADGDFDYFPVMSKLGPVMTPEDAYASARLGITEAIYSSAAFVYPRLERFERLERLEHPKRF